MESSKQLANRFREVVLNGKWIANTNFKDQISDLSWEEATSKVGELNTIALLTFHVNYYIKGVLQFFETGQLEIRDKYSFDMHPIDSDADWDDLKNDLFSNSERFADFVEKMSDDQLEAVFIDKKYGTYRRNIEGMIEHAYYHLGQVVLISRLVLST